MRRGSYAVWLLAIGSFLLAMVAMGLGDSWSGDRSHLANEGEELGESVPSANRSNSTSAGIAESQSPGVERGQRRATRDSRALSGARRQLEARVSRNDARPVPHVKVELRDGDHRKSKLLASAATGEDGVARLDLSEVPQQKLDSGDVFAHCLCEPWVAIDNPTPVHGVESQLTFVLHRQLNLSASILLPDGRPAVGCRVTLSRKSDGTWSSVERTLTDEAGRFTFDVRQNLGTNSKIVVLLENHVPRILRDLHGMIHHAPRYRLLEGAELRLNVSLASGSSGILTGSKLEVTQMTTAESFDDFSRIGVASAGIRGRLCAQFVLGREGGLFTSKGWMHGERIHLRAFSSSSADVRLVAVDPGQTVRGNTATVWPGGASAVELELFAVPKLRMKIHGRAPGLSIENRGDVRFSIIEASEKRMGGGTQVPVEWTEDSRFVGHWTVSEDRIDPAAEYCVYVWRLGFPSQRFGNFNPLTSSSFSFDPKWKR